jgi:hypothetical protein
VKIDGEEFEETDAFIHSSDNNGLVDRLIIQPWNEQRKKLGEPLVELIKVEVVNPFVHLHDWEKKRRDTYVMKQYFQCRRCKILGFQKIRIFSQSTVIEREPPNDKPRYELCKDQLKKMPTSLFYHFR